MLPNARRFAAPLAVVALVLRASSASAAPVPAKPAPSATPSPAASPEPASEAPESPRASVRAFLDLTTRRGDYTRAARYLVLPQGEEWRSAELAWRLRAVLERRLDVDLDAISPFAEGNTQDGLPPGVEALGQVPDGSGGSDTVFLVRTRDTAGAFWAFSRQTVTRVDGWYDTLPDRWVRDWMPKPLQRYGPGELMWWQWLALPVLLLVALALGRALGVATSSVLRRLAQRTPAAWDDRLLERVSPSLTLLWATAVAFLLLPRLALLPAAHGYVRSALGATATFAIFWSLWRSVDVWMQFLHERPWAVDNPSARSLLSVTRNLLKVLVALVGGLATLSALGYPGTTVLAGLGIGGIALAFGAQKTVENLFGSIAIAADQPFRVGDFVRIEDFTGNVERIGMRSTQVRTLDRTLITLPNGRLADTRVEDFASRDRIRFAATVSLACGTSEVQLRRVLEGIDALLRSQARVWPDKVVAKLAALGPSSVDLEVLCWYRTTDFDEFRELRQQALFGILRVVEQAGASFASPAPTVRVVVAPPAEGAPAAGAAQQPQRAE